MIELELTRDFCFFVSRERERERVKGKATQQGFSTIFVIVNNVNKTMFGFMNEANFLDMNFLYRQIYMLYACISIKLARVINTHLICTIENP